MKEHASQVLDQMLQTLQDMAAQGPTDREMEEDLALAVRQASDPDSRVSSVSAAARYSLTGLPAVSLDDLLREQRHLTAADCAKTLGGMLKTAILAMPRSAGQIPDSFNRYPISAKPVAGRTFRLTHAASAAPNEPKACLIIGTDGISFVNGSGGVSTVLWDQCVGFILESKGEWRLLGADGFGFKFKPEAFEGRNDIRSLIDRALPIPIRVGPQS
jgi:hypothetical protein